MDEELRIELVRWFTWAQAYLRRESVTRTGSKRYPVDVLMRHTYGTQGRETWRKIMPLRAARPVFEMLRIGEEGTDPLRAARDAHKAWHEQQAPDVQTFIDVLRGARENEQKHTDFK